MSYGNYGAQNYGKNTSNAGRLVTLGKLLNHDAMRAFLYPLANREVMFQMHDFTEVTFNGDPWTKTVDTGPDFAIAANPNGTVRFTTGTDDNEGGSLTSPAIFKGDLNAGAEVRLKGSSWADIAAEFGFIDDVTDKTTPSVTDVDTPAFGAGLAEGAVVHMDTDQTLKTMALVTDSATYTTATKALLYNNANPVAAFAPTADVYFTLRVQLHRDIVWAFLFDDTQDFVYATKIVPSGTTGGIEGGTALKLYLAFANKVGSASRTYDVDYISFWQDRF